MVKGSICIKRSSYSDTVEFYITFKCFPEKSTSFLNQKITKNLAYFFTEKETIPSKGTMGKKVTHKGIWYTVNKDVTSAQMYEKLTLNLIDFSHFILSVPRTNLK